MASFAFFVSASDGASQISPRHVGQAGAAQVPLRSPKTGQSNEHRFFGSAPPVEHLRNGHHPSSADDGAEPTQPLTCDVEKPVEGQGDVDLPMGAHEVDERTEQLLHDNETPVEDQNDANRPLGAESVDETTRPILHDDEALVEDPGNAHLAFGAHRVDETTPLVPRNDDSLVEGRRDAGPLRSLPSNRSATKLRKTRGNRRDDSRLSSGTLLAITAFLILESVAIVSVLPSILTRPSLDSTAAPRNLSAPVQPLPTEQPDIGVPAPVVAPALPLPVSSEAKAVTKAAPVSDEEDTMAPADRKAADRSGAAEIRVPSARGDRTTRSTLTEEEKAAVARGIQELEREAAQAKR